MSCLASRRQRLGICVRAASTVYHDIRGATLATIAGPTELDPFQSLSLMWIVGEPSWPLNLLVRPRDFMSLSATGIITRGNGDRIGYDLLQPAQLPQRARLPNRRARGKLIHGVPCRYVPSKFVLVRDAWLLGSAPPRHGETVAVVDPPSSPRATKAGDEERGTTDDFRLCALQGQSLESSFALSDDMCRVCHEAVLEVPRQALV
ncbi:hypothetical protein PsorP6_015935 [Peronosclerospora sorghi]|uniref:Uncharacterized protein n=1 Tax=Peronosclerospora sorghi TaxID=230839 RepID=A0ACC0WQV6_9STRA|nr:hypothetical protein PsorP6_015935 [Peronosclerospora sorghi]